MCCSLAGEVEEEGYEDEYQLEDIEIGAANYIKAEAVSNFRKAWEDTDPASEISDDYGLGVRDSLQVRAHVSIPAAHADTLHCTALCSRAGASVLHAAAQRAACWPLFQTSW